MTGVIRYFAFVLVFRLEMAEGNRTYIMLYCMNSDGITGKLEGEV
jgi:hypothetical protein